MDLTKLSDLGLALRSRYLDDQMEAATERGNPEAWREAAHGVLDCIAEYALRLGKPPIDMEERRGEVEALYAEMCVE